MTRPVGITGAQISQPSKTVEKSQKAVAFSVGWLDFSLPLSWDDATAYVYPLGIDLTQADVLGTRWRGYDNSAVFGKVRIGFDDSRVHVSVPASHLETLDWLTLRSALGLINEVEGRRIGRLDLTVDDKNRITSLEAIQTALDDGNIVTHYKKIEPRVKIVPRVSKDTTGITFGSRSSDSYLRVYDKLLESRTKNTDKEPENDFLRWELELKNERADAALQALVALEGDQAVWTLGLIRACVDFRVTDNANVTRCQTLVDWWSAFLDSAQKVVLAIPKAVDTYERVKDWVFRAVSPLLGVILQREGIDFVEGLAQYGKARWKDRHTKLLL
jgi:phage replication initiation protein